MLTVKNGNVHVFVPTNAERDEHEAAHEKMYDCDPFTSSETVLFDGNEWLGPKPSVEPEP